MAVGGDNCRNCPDHEKGNCDGNVSDCMCRRCPRNLGKCLITRYCSETESVLDGID